MASESLYRAEGICEGSIALQPSGQEGFGYDPVFVPDRIPTSDSNGHPADPSVLQRGAAFGDLPLDNNTQQLTFAQLSSAQKNEH